MTINDIIGMIFALGIWAAISFLVLSFFWNNDEDANN